MAKSSTSRFRNYATVVYPDSENTPDDWISILEETKVPLLVSPFHEFDVNPTGECKKPHYHVLVAFDGVKTPDQAKEIFDLVGGVGLETVASLRGYARYLCHLDNPEKFQYPIEQVRCLGGADFHSIVNLPTDKYKAIGEMIDYCMENQVYSYAALLSYCRKERFDWFRVLCDSGTLVMKEFLKSYGWTAKQFKDPADSNFVGDEYGG